MSVGTNGGTSYTRPGTVPARSDTVLVSSTGYNADTGYAETTTDPKGIVTKTLYDNLGRKTSVIEAYDAAVNSGNPTDSQNRTTNYTYDGLSHTTSLTADMPSGTNDQTTAYVYGVSTSDSPASGINSNSLLHTVKYPDKTTGAASASASDQNSFSYNLLGQSLTKTDQNGSVHTYSYDVLGRLTADTVSTLATGVDGTIRRIGTTYDTGGRPYQLTTYSDTSGTTVVNQIQRMYNGLGQLITEYQEHSGSVNTGTSLKVQYAYSEMASGANHSRLTRITYPNGRIVRYEYSSGLDNDISRLSFLADDSSGSVGTHLEEYSYLGLSTVVTRAHPEPGVDLTYAKLSAEGTADAGDQYTGLDRFGRIVDQRWLTVSTGTAVDRWMYAYDRDSNRLYKANQVQSTQSELYMTSGASYANGYDSLNRLTDFTRGTLSASGANGAGVLDTVTTSSRSQDWSLDALGNWKSLTTDGTAQTRTHNSQNQITSIATQTTPTYDDNGNTTTDNAGKTYVYDAWNHITYDGNSTAYKFAYDALGRRIHRPDGQEKELYYSASWQVLETRVAASMTVGIDQYVWSPVYVDCVVLRDRDTGSDGVVDERRYAIQDANYNTTSIMDTAGSIQKRFRYDPYGKATALDSSFASPTDASEDGWAYLYQGGRYDTIFGNLYYFRNRDLNPALGRWMQQDPLGYVGCLSAYLAWNSVPGNTTDAFGLDPPPLPDPVIVTVTAWGLAPSPYAITMTVTGELGVSSPSIEVTSGNGITNISTTWEESVRGTWETFGQPYTKVSYTKNNTGNNTGCTKVTSNMQDYQRYDARRTLTETAKITGTINATTLGKIEAFASGLLNFVPGAEQVTAALALSEQLIAARFDSKLHTLDLTVTMIPTTTPWRTTLPAKKTSLISETKETVCPCPPN